MEGRRERKKKRKGCENVYLGGKKKSENDIAREGGSLITEVVEEGK